VTGALDLAAGDSHSLMTIETPGGSQVDEQIAVDGKTWTRSGIAGPWFEKPASSSGRDLGRTLTKIGNVTDEGVVERDGRPVHHFGTVEGAVPASGLGLDGPGVSRFGGKFDLYADDSADLVGIGVSAEWKQTGAGDAQVPSSMALDFALSRHGRSSRRRGRVGPLPSHPLELQHRSSGRGERARGVEGDRAGRVRGFGR
jgi:hypothetical protein